MKVMVLTISDRAYAGEYEDLSGPEIEKIISGIPGADIERRVVPDDAGMIVKAMEEALDKNVIITTGGTGLGPRDITPEVTADFCDRMAPGIAEYLRARSLEETLNAVVSRGVAGIKGRTVVVNLPGSVKGAGFCARLLTGILPHACRMAAGDGH